MSPQIWVFEKFDVVFCDECYVTLDINVLTPYFRMVSHSTYYFSTNKELLGFKNKNEYERKTAFIHMFQRSMKEQRNS